MEHNSNVRKSVAICLFPSIAHTLLDGQGIALQLLLAGKAPYIHALGLCMRFFPYKRAANCLRVVVRFMKVVMIDRFSQR